MGSTKYKERTSSSGRTSHLGPRTGILLNSIALEPNRWTEDKIPYIELADLLPAIAKHGFMALEIWQYHVDRLAKGDLVALKSRLDSLGISTPVLGIYPTIHLVGDEGRAELGKVERLLDVATCLEAELVKMFVGSVASGKLDVAARGRSVAFLQEVTLLAEARRLRLTGETHANTLFDTIESTLWTLERLDPDRFGVCFQPYDASLLGAMGAFLAMRDRTWHLHFQGRKDGVISFLEESDLDYGAYTEFIASSGFEGYLSIEFVKDCVVSTPEDLNVEKVLTHAEKDRAFVRRHLV